MLDGLTNGFQLLHKDANLLCAETNNYFSVTNPGAEGKAKAIVKGEILAGNYVVTPKKSTIICAFGAVPKHNSNDLQLIHDCAMPKGLGVNVYISIDKQKFETINSMVKLVSKGCYMAKIDLCHAYRSVPVHLCNCYALGLK